MSDFYYQTQASDEQRALHKYCDYQIALLQRLIGELEAKVERLKKKNKKLREKK